MVYFQLCGEVSFTIVEFVSFATRTEWELLKYFVKASIFDWKDLHF